MPRARVGFAPAALRDLERLHEFLHPKNPPAAAALYRYDASKEKLLTVLEVRHQQEAGCY